jgi:hypothetical protein
MGTFNKTGLSLAITEPAEKLKTAPNKNKQTTIILSFFISVSPFNLILTSGFVDQWNGQVDRKTITSPL